MSDARHPEDEVLWKEIERERKGERWLILKSFVALAFVALLVVIRTLFFS
jgi:hypothetical protein